MASDVEGDGVVALRAALWGVERKLKRGVVTDVAVVEAQGTVKE